MNVFINSPIICTSSSLNNFNLYHTDQALLGGMREVGGKLHCDKPVSPDMKNQVAYLEKIRKNMRTVIFFKQPFPSKREF